MSITSDHRQWQVEERERIPGDPECRLCRGTGVRGPIRTDGTHRPCKCLRKAMAEAKANT